MVMLLNRLRKVVSMILNTSCRAQPCEVPATQVMNELRRAKNRQMGFHMEGQDVYLNLNLC
jgi:hypothetical protein